MNHELVCGELLFVCSFTATCHHAWAGVWRFSVFRWRGVSNPADVQQPTAAVRVSVPVDELPLLLPRGSERRH